jgi:uncharacterized protein YceK
MKNNNLLTLILVVSVLMTGCASNRPAVDTAKNAEVEELMAKHRLSEAFRELEREPLGIYR